MAQLEETTRGTETGTGTGTAHTRRPTRIRPLIPIPRRQWVTRRRRPIRERRYALPSGIKLILQLHEVSRFVERLSLL